MTRTPHQDAAHQHPSRSEIERLHAEVRAEEANAVAASERVFAALAVYDEWMAGKDPSDPEAEVYAFEAMKAAIAKADAMRATAASNSPVGERVGRADLGRYTPALVHYPDDDRLEFVAADIATVTRHLGEGCAVLLDMETREPVGFYVEQAAARLPALIASAPSPEAGGDLEELERLNAAAAPGLWSVSGARRSFNEESCVFIDAPSCAGLLVLATGHGAQALEALRDARFVVALVNAYRAGRLVAVLRRPGFGEAAHG